MKRVKDKILSFALAKSKKRLLIGFLRLKTLTYIMKISR